MKYFMLSEKELKRLISLAFEDGWYFSNENYTKTQLDIKTNQAKDYCVFKQIKSLENQQESEMRKDGI